MIRFLKKNILVTPLIISLFFYFLSIIIANQDKLFNYRWIVFLLWVFSLITFPVFLLVYRIKQNKFKLIDRRAVYLLIFILLFAGFFNFILLKSYPFVSIYDQVRDGGLNAMQIANGTIKNIFSYGRYASHGLIIPTIGAFFYHIFGNSVFTFRFPAALLTTLSAGLIFLTIKPRYGEKTALISALSLSSIQLVLYYARTEVVVTYSLFLFTLILYALSKWIANRKTEAYIILSTLLGFSAGFHTSIRTVSLIVLFIILLINLSDVFKKKNLRLLINFAASVGFYIVGFGPRILYTTFDIFFQTRSFNAKHADVTIAGFLIKILSNYFDSIQVYFLKPTFSTHFQIFNPILSPFFALFFILGVIVLIFKKDLFSKVLLFLGLILPLTNSAITETINSDNRLGGLYIISAIFVGCGVGFIADKIKISSLKFAFLGVIILLIIFQASAFFTNEEASRQYSTIDYLSMYTTYYLQSDKQYKNIGSVCLFSNSSFLEYAKLLHVQEQYEYFSPGYIKIFAGDSISDNEIFISHSCLEPNLKNYKTITYCKTKNIFTCPNGEINLEVEQKNSGEKLKPFNKNSLIINPNPVFVP